MKRKRLLLYTVLAVTLALMPLGTTHVLWPHFLWQNEPLHSFVEAVGAVAAILMAVVLLQRQPNEGGRRLFWVAIGLLGAGILDGFHAASQLGQGFVLLHSTAVLVGGFGFALVWLPESERYVFVRKWILWAVIIGSTLFGIWTLRFGGMLPVMVQNGEFTITARLMNLFSGVFFLAAGGRFLLDFHRPMKSEPYLLSYMALLFGLASLMFTYSALWDDGWWFWHAVRLSAYLLVMGFVVHRYIQTVLSLRTEVTKRRQTEEKLKHLYGILLTIRRINQIIVDIGNEAELLKKACEILVDGRNYKIAWIGSTSEGSYDVLPVAQAGFEEGYLSSVKITWDSEYGDGPTGMAIKTRRPSVMRDIPNDERYGPWREQALKRGYLSSAALPLLVDNKVIGALNVYSGKPDAFDDAEIDMLAELAGDISLGIQKIRQREALRKSEELFRLMVEEIEDYAIFMLDTEGRVVTWNEGAERIKGYVEQEIIGQHMSRFYTNDDIKQGKPSSLLKRAEAEGRIEDEGWRVRKDGSRFWANVIITAIRDNTGQLVAYSKVTRDLTERKMAEESIKQLSDYLQLQVSRMPIALIVWDTEFRVQSWNPAAEKIFGFSSAEALGKHPYDIIVPKEAQPHVDGIWRRLLEGDMTAYSTNENITKDGRSIICDWTNTPLKKDDATVLGVLSMVQDITDRKRAEERLAHLSTVLMAVRNVNQLITKEKQRDHLIQRACDLLVEKRSYEKAWILLLDENRNFVSAAGAGMEGAASVFLEQLKSGDFPACVNTLLAQKQPFSAYRKERELCGSCVLASVKVDEGAFICRLECEGKLYGVLGATVSSVAVSDKEEQDLFLELCGDIAFALANIEKTEKALSSERRYQTTVQTSIDGFLMADTKGHFIEVNDAYCRLLGYSREELLAMSLEDVDATETREDTARHIQRVVETGSDRFETKHRCRDGGILDLDISVNYISAEGLFFVFLRDITGRKQAEKQIALLLDRESQAAKEWQETFDAISDIVFQLSPRHEIRRINKAGCEATGKKLEDLIGMKCYNVVHGLDGPIRQCPCVEALKTKEVCTSEYSEGGRYYLLMAYPIFDKGGEIISLTHIVKDITQQKKMQEQLMVTDRLASIGQLASGIAHEMNNPLTGVIGFSEMLMKRTDLPDDAKEDLKIVNDEAQRTARVVKGLLTFARKQKPEKEPVDMNNIVQGVLQLRSYEHRVSNIEVNTRLAPELPAILGNSSQLQQVFINLMVNAEQAMLEAHSRGTLTIVTERAGDVIKASVADDGPGISPENMKKLFTPFFTTKEVGKGTGLGLSICHGIVSEHGGKIYAQSEPGKGASFVVELPIKK